MKYGSKNTFVGLTIINSTTVDPPLATQFRHPIDYSEFPLQLDSKGIQCPVEQTDSLRNYD